MSDVQRWRAPDLTPSPPPPSAAPVVEASAESIAAEPVALPLPPTLEELQAIRDAAQEEGFEQGHAEGYAQGQHELRRLVAQIEGILDNFSRPLRRLENEVVAALGELSVRIAGTLMGRAYEADPTLLARLVNEALESVSSNCRDVEVRLHPDDIAAVTGLLSLPAGQRLVADASLSRGDLRVHAEAMRINGTLDARLHAALGAVIRQAETGA